MLKGHAPGIFTFKPPALYWASPYSPTKRLPFSIAFPSLGIARAGDQRPQIAPDGETVAFIADDNNLWAGNVSNGSTIKISQGGSAGTGHFAPTAVLIYAWSPDSRRILYSQVADKGITCHRPPDNRPFDPNSRLGFFLFDLATQKTDQLEGFGAFDDWLTASRVQKSSSKLFSLTHRHVGDGREDQLYEWVVTSLNEMPQRGPKKFLMLNHAIPSWLDDRFVYFLPAFDEARFLDLDTLQMTICHRDSPLRAESVTAYCPPSRLVVDIEVAHAAAAQEAQIHAHLAYIRRAITSFQVEHQGTSPRSIWNLIPKFLPELPTLALPHHGQKDTVIEIANDAAMDIRRHLCDSGKWLYIADSKSKNCGLLIVDCMHRSSYGVKWYER